MFVRSFAKLLEDLIKVRRFQKSNLIAQNLKRIQITSISIETTENK